MPAFVAQARGLSLASKTILSSNEFSDYPTAAVYSPADNTVIQTPDGKNYVFLSGAKHPASAFVISQRGLGTSSPLSVSLSDASLFETSSVLPPKDGTVIRGKINLAVYLVQNGEIELFSPYTFAQSNIKAKQIVLVPDDEISTYTQNGFVPPKDGSLVKAQGGNTIYLVQDGLKHAVIPDIFKNQGYRQSSVGIITSMKLTPCRPRLTPNPKITLFLR